ncbi:MAG: hypothetical protein JXJ04_08125 [Spirochaetales bacterium]|nr:hypothetical protein [Spirochaetales bacterium]
MKKFSSLFFIILLFLALALPAYPAGKKEDKLAQAKVYIEQKQYNEALFLISEVIREEPDRFDEAVKLSDKIYAIRAKYNEKYEELIIALYDEQDVEKGLNLIAELEELDPNPNVQTDNVVEQARLGASLVANLNYFDQIMDKALAYISQKEFLQGIAEYKKGFTREPPLDLHKSEYESVELGTILKTDLNEAFSTLLTSTDSFVTLSTELKKKRDEILTNVSFLDAKAPVPPTREILDYLFALSQSKKTIEEKTSFIREQNDKLRQRGQSGSSILFLKYTYQLIMGRDSLGTTEGIISTMNQFLDSLMTGIDDTYTKEANILLEQGKEYYLAGRFEDAANVLKRGRSIMEQILPVAYFFDTREKFPSDYIFQTPGNWIISDTLPHFMDSQENLKEILAYLYVIENLPGTFSFEETAGVISENQYNKLESDLATMQNIILLLLKDWETYIRDRSEKTSLSFDKTRAESILSLASHKAASIIKEKVTYLSSIYNELVNRYEQENNLLENGIPHEQYGVVYFPDQRIKNFISINTSLVFISGKLQSIKKEWEKGILTGSAMGTVIDETNTLYSEVTNLIKTIAEKRRIAENNVLQGKKFKDLGNTRFDEAQLYLKRKDFIKTESKIGEASTAFRTSLSFQEDEEVRAKDAQLVRLSRSLENEKNEVAIKEYRRLMEQGKNLYSNGLYEEAYDAFIQAQEVWNSTKSEENPENKDWLAYVLTALTIESARTINETDPLYKEVSQLFNLAKDDYNKAIELVKQGKMDEALLLFKNAEEKLIIITKQFPYNNDARLLKLLILKVTDEKAFNRTFSERMSEAKQKINGSNQDKQVAYIDLKDLADIDPNYPGLKKMITDLEYALGIKRRLPTAAEKKQSKEYTAQAKPIILNRDYDRFPQARKLLGDALKLDPDNQEAKNLYDKMGVEAGSEKKIVISANATKLYERAEQLYTKGQYIEAYDIVANLIKDKANKGYEPLIDLEKKLKAVLGIQ